MPTDVTRPVLPGDADTDYARYMRTDELLALQRTPEQWVHPDELLFQITHQSTELWLKLATAQLLAAAEHVAAGRAGHAELLVQRASTSLRLITGQLDILRHLTPADFARIRPALGNGSGAESPGWQGLRRAARALGKAFDVRLTATGTDLDQLYGGDPTAAPYRLAESLVELDERIALWRTEHYKMATRIIGHAVLGTQGTPVDTLARLIAHKLYPKLWAVRTRITSAAGSPLDTAGPSLDAAGPSCDAAGSPLDAAGSSLDAAGPSCDAAGSPLDAAGSSLDAADGGR